MSVYGYRYGRVPEMLLYSDASDRACRLHAVLTRWADTKAGQQPTRDELASILRCSVDSLDRAVKELRDGGFLEVRPQFSEDGRARIANDYVLLENRTGAATPGRTDAATLTSTNAETAGEGGRTVAAGGGRTGAAAIEVRDRTQRELKEEGSALRASAPPRPEIADLCELLADEMVQNGNERPFPSGRPPQRWLDAARLLVDRDGFTVEAVRYLILWSQNDEFWRANILSMPKLRDKRVTLKAQAKRDADRRNKAPARYSLNGDTVTAPTDLLAWARRGDTAEDHKALEARP